MIPEYIQISKLSNNLSLITINQPWKEGIYCYASINVGSCDEQLKRDKGICHFIEHMVFRGTEDYTEGKINKLIVGRGGYYNGTTSYSYTQYDLWSQKKYFNDTISILENLVFKPVIRNDILNIEREIIMEEAMEIKSDPYSQSVYKSYELLFPNHNFKYPIIGTESSIQNITATRMKEYIRGYYRPQTIILTLCGNLPEQNELEDILYHHANSFVRKTRASNSTILNRNFGDYQELTSDITKEETWENIKSSVSLTSYAFDSSEMYKQERMALSILTNIIGGDSNSMMFQQIRSDQGLCYNCGAYNTILRDHIGCYSFYLFSRNNKIKQAEDQLDGILQDVSNGKITEDNISEAKNSLLGNHMRNMESGNYLSRAVTQAYLGDPDKYCSLPWEIETLINNVDKKQLVEIAQKILSTKKVRYRILNEE